MDEAQEKIRTDTQERKNARMAGDFTQFKEERNWVADFQSLSATAIGNDMTENYHALAVPGRTDGFSATATAIQTNDRR
jgi:hypothetical protein